MAYELQSGVAFDNIIEPFVMRHRFLDMSDPQFRSYKHLGPVEEHGHFSWRLFVYPNPKNDNFEYGVECLKNHKEVEIETWTEAVLSADNKVASMTRHHTFRCNSFTETTDWDEAKTLLKCDGGIRVAVRIETKKVFWVAPINRNYLHQDRWPSTKNWTVKRFLIDIQMCTDEPIDECSDDQLFPMKDLTYANVQEALDVFTGTLKLDDKRLLAVLATATKMKLTDVIRKCEQFLKLGSKRSKPVRLQMARQFNLAALENHLSRFEGAEMCFIDTTALNCPVCIEIFDGEPLCYPCGHTVCYACSESLKELGRLCPVCRKPAHSSEKNFALINILESLNLISANKKMSQKADCITLSSSNNHLRRDNARKTKKLAAQGKEIDNMKCLLGVMENQKYVPIDEFRQTEEQLRKQKTAVIHEETVVNMIILSLSSTYNVLQREFLQQDIAGLRAELANAKHEIELMTKAKQAQEKVHQENIYAKNIYSYVTLSLLFCFVMYFGYIKM